MSILVNTINKNNLRIITLKCVERSSSSQVFVISFTPQIFHELCQLTST